MGSFPDNAVHRAQPELRFHGNLEVPLGSCGAVPCRALREGPILLCVIGKHSADAFLLQAGDKADTPGTNIGDKTGEVASEAVAKSVPSKVSLPSVPTETVRYADYDFSSKVAYTQYEGATIYTDKLVAAKPRDDASPVMATFDTAGGPITCKVLGVWSGLLETPSSSSTSRPCSKPIKAKSKWARISLKRSKVP